MLMPDPMMQQPTHELLFFRVRLLLEEGQSEQALIELEALHTEDEKHQQEKAYFLGWCYVLNKRWDDAMHVLLPFSRHEGEQDEQTERIERERKARSLLRLGYAAINLNHFEDTEQHLRACLKVLRHKQLQGPEFQLLRIQANYSLGVSSYMRGFYTVALEQYKEALRLFLYVDNDEELANIYYGLCDTYRKAGRFAEARQAGEKALQLYVRTANRALEGRIRNQLGHIAFQRGDLKAAGYYFTEALAIAASLKSVQMVMINCEALANLRTAENHFDQARRYCQLAQEMSRETQNNFLRGHAYLMAGKVAQAEAQQAAGELKQALLEEATKQLESLTRTFHRQMPTMRELKHSSCGLRHARRWDVYTSPCICGNLSIKPRPEQKVWGKMRVCLDLDDSRYHLTFRNYFIPLLFKGHLPYGRLQEKYRAFVLCRWATRLT